MERGPFTLQGRLRVLRFLARARFHTAWVVFHATRVESCRPAVQKLNAWTAGGSLGRGNITKSPEYPYNVAFEVFSAKSAAMHQHPRASAFDNGRASLYGWQDRVRDPSLTVLLVLQVFLLFVAVPLAAAGVPIAEPVAGLLLLVAVTLVVVLSRRGAAIVIVLLGLAPPQRAAFTPENVCSPPLLLAGNGHRPPRACWATAGSYSRSRP